MKFILVAVVFILTGCAGMGGTPPGGAGYDVEFNADGTWKAHADVLNESDSVELTLTTSADGVKTFAFRKVGTSGTEMMAQGIERNRMLLQMLLGGMAQTMPLPVWAGQPATPVEPVPHVIRSDPIGPSLPGLPGR